MWSCNDTLFKTKIYEIDTSLKTKPSENHTLSGRTSSLRTCMGVLVRASDMKVASDAEIFSVRLFPLRDEPKECLHWRLS